MLLQRHQRARHHARGIALGGEVEVLGPVGHLDVGGKAVAVALLGILVLVDIALELAVLVARVALLLRLEVGRGLLEIIGVDGRGAGGEGAPRHPAGQVLDVGVVLVGIGKERPRAARHRVVGRHAVADHHLLVPVRELEVIGDAVALHQPRHEIEIGLAMLHAVFDRREGLLALVVRADAVIAQHLGDDGGDGLVREDLRIGALAGHPQRRGAASAYRGRRSRAASAPRRPGRHRSACRRNSAAPGRWSAA